MKIPEGIYRLEDPDMAALLFSGRREVMIDACLQGGMGCVYGTAGGMDSAAAVLGDFCFLAGKPEERLIAWDYGRQYLLLAPPDAAWRAADPGGDASCGDHPFPDPWGVIRSMS